MYILFMEVFMIEYIGIDIGGTNIRVGAVNKNNDIVYINKESTLENVSSSEELYRKIKEMIIDIPNYKEAKSIGIGVPGAIRNNRIITARNLIYLKDFPLYEKLKQDFNKEVYIENDAKVAALAQALKGVGKNFNKVCYVTLSTGVGGGVVIDKKIYQGSNNIAGYFSRMILDGKNVAENLISGTALVNKAKKKRLDNIKSSYELFKYSEENEIASKIVEEFIHDLVVLLLNISITLNPDIIILGGGVMKSSDYFLGKTKNEFYNLAHSFAKDTKIEKADLEEPGVIGAAMLCLIK